MRPTTCKGCGEQIVFLKTGKINPRTGKEGVMPVNVETVEIGDEQLDLKRHVSHFANCKAASTFRKDD